MMETMTTDSQKETGHDKHALASGNSYVKWHPVDSIHRILKTTVEKDWLKGGNKLAPITKKNGSRIIRFIFSRSSQEKPSKADQP